VKTNAEVRKTRYCVLAELFKLLSLVENSKAIVNLRLTNETSVSAIEALGEAIQARTRSLVTRANQLLEIVTPLTALWKEEMRVPSPLVRGDFSAELLKRVVDWATPPASTRGTEAALSTVNTV
jgi:hypothetical protein